MTDQAFQQLTANCQPHQVFKTDWFTYSSLKFADTFLPKVAEYRGKAFYFFDGAEILLNAEKVVRKLMQLTQSKELIIPVFYSYPKGVLAENRKARVEVESNAIGCFLEVYQNENVDVSFKFGGMFGDFLENHIKENKLQGSVAGFQWQTYNTTISKIQGSFNNEISHFNMLNFVGEVLGMDFKKVHESVQLKVQFIKNEQAYFTPFGLLNPVKKDSSMRHFSFDFEILNQEALEYHIHIFSGNQSIYSRVFLPKINILPEDKRTTNSTKPQYYKPGKYTIEWDGFDNSGILDSKWFLDKLKVQIEVIRLDKKGVIIEQEVAFKKAIENANWLDVRISKPLKKVDILLRLNLTNGGANGVGECEEIPIGADETITKCPWDDVPQTVIDAKQKAVLKARNRSFEDLVKLAVEGFKKHWSRNENNIGKGIMIDGIMYQVNVDAALLQNENEALNSVPIIYNTNKSPIRSGNTGGSYKDDSIMDNVLEKIPDGIIQRIAYNVGYIKYSDGWGYKEAVAEDLKFMQTAAHEIGHELLQAYAGTVYSWQHKGSSYFFPQDTKPVIPNWLNNIVHKDYMPYINGENCPAGEIDVMKYYNDYSSYYERIVASNSDILGLLWLLKCKIA